MKANLENQKYFLSLVADGTLTVSKKGVVHNTKTGKTYTRKTNKGYIEIAAKRDGKKVHILAHRLTFLVHKGDLGEDDQVNHKDGIKHNNSIKNFEKTDNQGNCQHAYDTGLRFIENKNKIKSKLLFKGERGSNAKLTNKQAQEIRELYKTGKYTQKEIGEMFGIARPTVGHVISKRTFKPGFFLRLNNRKNRS